MKNISKKVGDIWHCGKCDGEFFECDYSYILNVDLEHVTGYLHGVIAFDDAKQNHCLETISREGQFIQYWVYKKSTSGDSPNSFPLNSLTRPPLIANASS